MTDFLRINEWPISVLVGNGKRGATRYGGRGPAMSGAMRSTDRAQKRSFPLRTIPVSNEIAESVEGFMRGLGQHWSFNDSLYSAVNGLGPDAGYNVTIGSTGTTKFGNKVIAGVTTATNVLVYTLDLGTRWTVMYWQQSGTSGTWNHFVQRSSGNPWQDGAQSNPAVQSVVVTSSSISLRGNKNDGSTGTTQCYDDLVALPFYLADEAIPYFYARTAAFSDLPRLFIDGRIDSASLVADLEMEGDFQGSDFIPGSGAILSEVNFTLQEV